MIKDVSPAPRLSSANLYKYPPLLCLAEGAGVGFLQTHETQFVSLILSIK